MNMNIQADKCTITHLFFSNSKKITFRQTEAGKRGSGSGGRGWWEGGGGRREEESLQNIFIWKKAVTLTLMWPPVVLVTIQQIANENSYSNPQLAAYAVTGLLITCLHPNYPMVSDMSNQFVINEQELTG